MGLESINWGAVAAATVTMFVVGAIWYTPLFGNLWGKMHGFDKYSKKEQNEMRAQMMPLLLAQFVVTIFSALGLVYFAQLLPELNIYALGFWVWLAFLVPTHVSDILFGGTEAKWLTTKILIQMGGAFACTMAACFVISLFV